MTGTAKNGTITKVWGTVAGFLIGAAILGGYTYTHETYQTNRQEIARLAHSTREDVRETERKLRAEQIRIHDQVLDQIKEINRKLDRLIDGRPKR